MEFKEFILEAKLPRALKRKAKKSKGTLHAYDMDETLFKNDHDRVRIGVRNKNTGDPIKSLSNTEFNSYELGDDEDFDFSDFKSADTFASSITPNKRMIKDLKRNLKRNKPVEIVTARSDFDNKDKVAKTLKRYGIDIKNGKNKVHLRRAGNVPGSDIGQKKGDILAHSADRLGVKRVRMYDDAKNVLKGVDKRLGEKRPDLNVKTKLVAPDKKGEVRHRTFKEFLELE